ncbi:hypothetical protein BCR33DRAFT_852329 [Rhizoclosmatium globosum]|uniref:Uncharacterized protein n=1 Tax=Rhizoclosmatium globosum TaxID=329046 RepID=A0A1Y2C2T5_9FUNG|nr:hypothetical protein BCR33DRAFT_852329 [Rhizoclosmatium globosum]|eukprot:ORY41340.1 hypothetical protein BCR33DRAFT_852329 [Rhizoclosmatium globosum]
MVVQDRKASVASNASVVEKISSYRPRFFMLMSSLIAICTITVGVLGWQLTFNAAKRNIETLVSEIEDVVSNQISTYIQDEAKTLMRICQMQAGMFATNQWSFSTPERKNSTLKAMLVALNAFSEHTFDMYYYTYPEGLNFGYYFSPTGMLQLWTQENMTQYTFNSISDGTVNNPGNNNTLWIGPGGMQGSNLNFSDPNSSGYSNIYLFEQKIFVSAYHIAVNRMTNEQVTFGADWTMTFLTKRLTQILATIPYPMFCAIVEPFTGYIVTLSSNASLTSDDQSSILSLNDVQDPFMQDFSSYLNTTYKGYELVDQLKAATNLVSVSPLFTSRKLQNANWQLQMQSVLFGKSPYLFLTYLNVDAVEIEVSQVSTRTGYIMLGIILAFLLAGTLFSVTVSSQLNLVRKQIGMLKQLKFHEVLDKESGVKGRSFIHELADLQQSFHEMVQVFASTIKTSQSLRSGQPSNQTSEMSTTGKEQSVIRQSVRKLPNT